MIDRPPLWRPHPLLYRAEGVLYMCGAGSLHTDWWGPAARPGPGGSGYSLPPSHSVLPSCIVDAARYGGAAVGDVRGQVARFWSSRLRPRRVRVSVPTACSVLWRRGVWRPRRGRRGRSTPDPGRLVAAGVEPVRLKDPPGYVQPDALKSCLVNCYDHPGVIPPTLASEHVGVCPGGPVG